MCRPTRILLPLLLVGALAAGCGGDDDEVEAGGPSTDSTTTTVDPDTAVSSPPLTDDGTTPDVTWARIEPSEDLVDPVVATPVELVPDPEDPEAVLVHFYGGVPECYGARATVVDENANRIRIRLEVGGRPTAGDGACIEIAEAQELKVVVAAPVAGRRLVAVTAA